VYAGAPSAKGTIRQNGIGKITLRVECGIPAFGNGNGIAQLAGMRQKDRVNGIFCILLIATGLPVRAEVATAPVYHNGFSATIKLGRELSEALPNDLHDQLDPQVVTLQMEDSPVVAPLTVTEENHVLRQVSLSAGFIDLVNHIAHAKAIDRVQKGYFQQYIRNFALLSSGDSTFPNIVEPRYWSEDIMNDQLGYFNQIVSTVMAINLSHHYLGHYVKYSGKLIGPNDKPVPINVLLTSDEWSGSVKAGAVNALNCALSTEGLRALLEAIDQMPHRPEWAAYIVPQNADLKGLDTQLQRYEEDFFHGRLK
jgi:hypothetical protein